jgi:hypothetical protein
MIRGPSTGAMTPGWAVAAQSVPGTITAVSQAASGYYGKTGRGAEAQGKAALANAHANAINAQANLLNAQANASGSAKVGGLDLTTWIILGGGIIAAAIIMMRR